MDLGETIRILAALASKTDDSLRIKLESDGTFEAWTGTSEVGTGATVTDAVRNLAIKEIARAEAVMIAFRGNAVKGDT